MTGAPDLTALAHRVMDEWRGRHADWAPGPFAEAATTAGAALAQALADAPDAERVLDAYLRLVAEALQLRYLDRGGFLGRCLLEIVPRRLAAYPAERRLALLADVWNLGEGLQRQAPWMSRIASALLRDADDLERLGPSLAAVLAPLVTEARRSSFAGPFAVQVVDMREVDDEFLPGRMHAAAPSVLCVHDRFRDDLHGAVALAAGGSSRSLGTTPCLAGGDEVANAPDGVEVSVGLGRALIAGRELALPTVAAAHAHLMLPSGFVAVSAVDSQRLWIVESAS